MSYRDPRHVAAAIDARKLGWKWSTKNRFWYWRIPGTDVACTTKDVYSIPGIGYATVIVKKRGAAK